ncbi:hypothetical protein NDU88_002698 [Pleurodeles waltl]|uniref:Uncharacterized protein n=1 Tax=Pleurodeles waltl TaxID=8319 RepID=A0AAV7MY64_PLEWA|nr:hypothetical protein NDU88_002698 [Pleurodeles waltl]
MGKINRSQAKLQFKQRREPKTGKIDSLSYRVDRMPELIDKHAERLDTVEKRVSNIEDEWATSAEAQKHLEKTISVLQAKAEELEGRFQRNNLHLIIELLDHEKPRLSIAMQRLSDSHRERLMTPPHTTEIAEALKGMPSGSIVNIKKMELGTKPRKTGVPGAIGDDQTLAS